MPTSLHGQRANQRPTKGHFSVATIASVVLLSLTSCQNVDDENEPPRPWDEPAPTEYPDVRDVPPRPQLSYSVQQQRAVVEGLIADRENARYTDLAVRYRSGLSNLPPPPARPDVSAPAAAAAKVLVPTPPRPDPPPVNVTEADPIIGNRDNGGFSDFLRGMVHDTAPEPATTEDTPEPQTNLTPSELLQNLAAEAEASSKRIAVPAAAPDDFKRAELLALGRMIRLARATDAMAATAPVATATPVSAPEL